MDAIDAMDSGGCAGDAGGGMDAIDAMDSGATAAVGCGGGDGAGAQDATDAAGLHDATEAAGPGGPHGEGASGAGGAQDATDATGLHDAAEAAEAGGGGGGGGRLHDTADCMLTLYVTDCTIFPPKDAHDPAAETLTHCSLCDRNDWITSSSLRNT